jgi:hypothetical protein
VSNPKTTQDILRALQDTINIAEMGFEMTVSGKLPDRMLGIKNLVVFGRAVTNVLENLRSTEPDFDKWYEKYKKEMQADPLMKYFYKLRSEILKEGRLRVGWKAYINLINQPIDERLFGPPPPNAVRFFTFDSLGGTGWIVQLPDGSTENYYVNMPSNIASISYKFPDSPESHLGKAIPDNSVQSLARLYLDYLQQIVKDAKTRFGQKQH